MELLCEATVRMFSDIIDTEMCAADPSDRSMCVLVSGIDSHVSVITFCTLLVNYYTFISAINRYIFSDEDPL